MLITETHIEPEQTLKCYFEILGTSKGANTSELKFREFDPNSIYSLLRG